MNTPPMYSIDFMHKIPAIGRMVPSLVVINLNIFREEERKRGQANYHILKKRPSFFAVLRLPLLCLGAGDFADMQQHLFQIT
jgi:hypothetical protein